MNKIFQLKRTEFRKITILLLAFIGLCILGSGNVSSAQSAVDSKIEPSMEFEGNRVETNIPPMIIHNRLMLPMRDVFRLIDASIEWDDASKTVTGTKSNTTLTLQVGRSYATVNGTRVNLDSPAVIINNYTLVPFRFVAEAFDLEVQWNSTTKTAYIQHLDGVEGSNDNDVSPVKTEVLQVGSKKLYIGQSETDLLNVLGQPGRKDPYGDGTLWYIFNANYAEYVQAAVKDGKVVSLFTNAESFIFHDQYQFGMDMKGKSTSFRSGHVQAKIFVDEHMQNTATSILLTSDSWSRTGVLNAAIISGYELQLLDLANSVRVRKGLSPMKWDAKLADVAREHSIDMGVNEYFSHDSQNGDSPFDRMKNAGLSYSLAAENIAYGYRNAIEVHEGWMNSSGHRKNILSNNTHFGAGIAAPNGTLYYTQNFYVPR